MRLPASTLTLAGGLTCPTRVVPREVWLAHVVKHPLGLDALSRRDGPRRWNDEGWDQLQPPVIPASERDGLVKNIASLEVNGARCEVPEFRTKRAVSDLNDQACYRCPNEVAGQCSWVLDGVSRAYAGVIESMLSGFAAPDTVVVPRVELTLRLMRKLTRPEAWRDLTVLSVGTDDRAQRSVIARISRADGVRAEFYLRGTQLEWRTTWRKPPPNPGAAMSFLLDFPQVAPSVLLSESCVVQRLWWESP